MCLRPRAWTPVYSGHRLRGFLPGVWKRIDRADAKHIQLDAEQRPPCVDRREPFRGADLAMSEWRIARAVPDHPLFLGWWTPSVSAERDAAKLGVAARLLDVRADDDEDSRFGEDCGHYEPSPGFEPGTDDRAVDVGVTSTEAWKIAAQGAKP
ncbi:hypothetical protein PsYK624_066520 [Phanerochaete sordida]|uniref:Uncharacterized protein n=1 Tax=Phanerochaete sordida TaxID=48140 RepID=A0A9P3G9G5_9APHY|nr:hypothetical protein PsYK624_066520 [Phanerochaete sordida]